MKLLIATLALVALVGCEHEAEADTEASVTTTTAAPASVDDWMNGGGRNHLETMADSMDAVSQAALYGSSPEVVLACEDMLEAIDDAQSFTEIPVEAVRSPYEAGLAAFEDSAEACIDGYSTNDIVLMLEATEHLQTGEALINEATLAMEHAA